MAKSERADSFVSIHFNGNESAAVRGTEVFVRADANQNVNRTEDLALANRLLAGVVGVIPGGKSRGVNDDDQSQHPAIGVLNDTLLSSTAARHPVRSCLVEIEFITKCGSGHSAERQGPIGGAPANRGSHRGGDHCGSAGANLNAPKA